MIRVVATKRDGSKMLILGIDKSNVTGLLGGHPIAIKSDDLELELDMCIIYGETVTDVLEALRKAGINVPTEITPGETYEIEQP